MSSESGFYLYAATGPNLEVDLAALAGVRARNGAGEHPYVLRGHALDAVVSRFDGGNVRPDRGNLSAHQAVLRALMSAHVAFLPAAFGIVAPSRPALTRMLQLHQGEILENLRALTGKVEMRLKVSWDVPNIFEYIVAQSPPLRRLRDACFKMAGAPSHNRKMELGQMFEAERDEMRSTHRSRIEDAIGDSVLDLCTTPPRKETDVLDLACLIDRDREDAFEKAVFRCASLFDDNYTFDLSGPWPPYGFVHVSFVEAASRTTPTAK